MKEKIPKSKILALASIVAVTFAVSILLIQDGDAENLAYDGPPKAAIIDQLYDEMPNENFHQKATEYLEAAGYEVDIFTTKDVTVDFYKNLPTMNYKYVVLRSHSIGSDGSSDDSVKLFTGERYTEDKYIMEQLSGYVKKGTPLLDVAFVVGTQDSSKWLEVNGTRILKVKAEVIDQTRDKYFVITPKLVEELMVGKFSGTTFVLGGCETLSNTSLAKPLIERGASLVVGWDDSVSSFDNDRIMLLLLEKMLIRNLDIEDALNEIEGYLHHELMPFPANFIYYSNKNI